MEELDYADVSQEIDDILKGTPTIVLATCADNKVTARTMAPVNDGLTVLFATDGRSEKIRQMAANPHIALVVGNLRVEAVAELFGRPKDHPSFTSAYLAKFPHYGDQYPEKPDDMLVIAHPVKMSLFKYLGKPCEDVVVPGESRAYRIDLS